jgi:type I restriction enzyme, R subunit
VPTAPSSVGLARLTTSSTSPLPDGKADGHTGVVDHIDSLGGSKSQQLADALQSGTKIIIVTIQTFPYALGLIRSQSSLAGKTFAVIADEAHSSQAGEASKQLKAALTATELDELADGGTINAEDVLAAEMTARAESKNLSFFAFTATPKAKTLELFGHKGIDGLPHPFHLYSMQQAIEEGFILDVLKGLPRGWSRAWVCASGLLRD